MSQLDILHILEKVKSGELEPSDAITSLKMEPFQDLGFAKVDHHREVRQGACEVIYGAGKTTEHIIKIAAAMLERGQKTIMITRISPETAADISEVYPLDYSELAKIGEVYLNGGCFEGKRLLPESWIKAAVSRQTPNREGGYGYYIWVQPHSFSISGKWGQKCILYPETRMSVSWLGNMPEDSRRMENTVRAFLEG